MTKGIDLAIAADTRSAMSAIQRGVLDPLEDVAELLEDVGREGEDAGQQLVDGMRDAQRRTRDAKDEIKDIRDALDKAGRGGKNAGDDIKDGMRRAEDGVSDFKEEANSTAREAAASFDGSAESIGSAFQEVAANAFAGFGPAGAVAGLAAAAGIGLVIQAFTSTDEARQASQERAAEWADSWIEAGGRTLTAGVQLARFQAILTDPEKFKEAETNARNWGTSIDTAVSAMSGNAGAISDVSASLREQRDAAAEAAREAQELAQANGGQLGVLTQQEQAYLAGAAALGQLTGEMDAGQQRAQLLAGYYADLINSTSGVVKEVDDLGNELYSLPDGTQVYVDAETGQASQNVQNFKGDVDSIPEAVTTTVRFRADSAAFESYWGALQSRASRGITVNVKPGQGRFWE